ncbi:hypothetical protein FisN_4Lh560 [Fistulifera solaris]|uniref:PHD-type domain-containing protein n=1 Tax=Fistulifera solaris TaxID=1519565 RepID=A0A1Z5KE72_FISSO|nr:hypothetical protein FisN_4Lh560 [Fistulifera solaris]|eukprot:GAX24425.1 hypothetical protein FisN_4Lh560 [Fistulifera solaris]
MSHTPNDGDDELLDTGCLVCGNDDHHDKMLLCDACTGEYHMHCLKPKLDKIPQNKWFCAICKGGEGTAPAKLEELVSALPSEYRARFGEICWAQGGVGYGWWPCCIFDPRWAKGKPLEEAKRQLGKKYLVYFYMCTDSPFALLAENKTMSWLEGLSYNYYQGKAAKNYSKDRFALFQKALLIATNEFDKSVSERYKSLNLSRKNTALPQPGRPILSPSKVRQKPAATSSDAKRKLVSKDESSSKRTISQQVGTKNIIPRPSRIEKEKKMAQEHYQSSEHADRSADTELICTVWNVADVDNFATSTQVGFVILASIKSSTFEDVRTCISREIDLLSETTWQFWVPLLGPVSRAQERLFGPILPFFAKRKLAGDTMTGDGTIHHPLRLHVIQLDK